MTSVFQMTLERRTKGVHAYMHKVLHFLLINLQICFFKSHLKYFHVETSQLQHSLSHIPTHWFEWSSQGGTKGQTGFQGLNSPPVQCHLLPGRMREARRWLQLSWPRAAHNFWKVLPGIPAQTTITIRKTKSQADRLPFPSLCPCWTSPPA